MFSHVFWLEELDGCRKKVCCGQCLVVGEYTRVEWD